MSHKDQRLCLKSRNSPWRLR